MNNHYDVTGLMSAVWKITLRSEGVFIDIIFSKICLIWRMRHKQPCERLALHIKRTMFAQC